MKNSGQIAPEIPCVPFKKAWPAQIISWSAIIRARDGVGAYFSEQFEKRDAEEIEKEVVRNKEIDLEVMSVDEAMLQLELLEHDFYMFINEEDHKVTLIYLREDGNYGTMRVK